MATKRIERADSDVKDALCEAMDQWHEELVKAEVVVSVLMVHPPVDGDGVETGAPALTLHGAPCFAKIKRLSAEDRAMTQHAGVPVDARIEIDAERWAALSKKQRLAMMDHELSHLYLREDSAGVVMEQDDGRPKLFMRADDWQINGFKDVTERHGRDSIEFATLTQVVEERLDGQLWFSFSNHKNVLIAAAARQPGACTLHPDKFTTKSVAKNPKAKKSNGSDKAKRGKKTSKKGASARGRGTRDSAAEEIRPFEGDKRLKGAIAKNAAKAALKGLAGTVEKLDGVESVTLSAGGKSVTIKRGQRQAASQ